MSGYVSVYTNVYGNMSTYYTNKQVREILQVSQSTIDRTLSKMNIKIRRFGIKGRPRYLALDIHSFMEFNKSFNQCNQKEKQEVRELLISG